jgi:hypothetical protein
LKPERLDYGHGRSCRKASRYMAFPKKNHVVLPSFFVLVKMLLLGDHQQPGFQQFFRQPVDGLGKFIGNSAHTHAQQRSCFGLGVLLKDDAA